VLEAARQLGYEPNDIARSLRAGTSMTIGFLMPTMHNPHYWEILEGAEEEITSRGYHLALVIANLNPERELFGIRSLLQHRLDGLILVPTFLEMYAPEREMLQKNRTPIVYISPVEGANYIIPDIQHGAEAIMDHLIALEHRRIGLICGAAHQDLTLPRLEVYQAKLRETGLPVEEGLTRFCGPAIQDGYRAAQELLALPQPPSAIWSINDLLAMGALHAVSERGLRVPEEVALAGFDDIPLAGQLSPPLTTVHNPARQLGRRAAEILFWRLENPNAEPVQEVLPTRLIIRQSTCRLPPPMLTHPGEVSKTGEAGRKGGETVQV
jgi:LacI family transcriptional regulator